MAYTIHPISLTTDRSLTPDPNSWKPARLVLFVGNPAVTSLLFEIMVLGLHRTTSYPLLLNQWSGKRSVTQASFSNSKSELEKSDALVGGARGVRSD